ncbi:MAG: hypothetical protein C0598_04140 [Marinilabiliales bacterium]|nr:MAG: hypothetical protein C0598_04140 [Marinilabiliales bacterium]
MKIKLPFLFGILILISSCLPENESTFSEFSMVNYDIVLNGNRITEYTVKVDNNEEEKVTYVFTDSLVYKTTRNTQDSIIFKHTYYIGSDSLAYKSIDSGYRENDGYYVNYTYDYENGFLVKTTGSGFNRVYDQTIDFTINNTVFEDNIISIEQCYSSACCTDGVLYNNFNNLLDVDNFSNGLLGNINKKLIDMIIAENCNSQQSTFTYEFDDDGYVVNKVETFTRPPGGSYNYYYTRVTTTKYTYTKE